MAASVQSSSITADEYTDPKSVSFTVASGANLLWVTVLAVEPPTSVKWNTTETLTYVGTPQTILTSLEGYHYYLKNPTVTTANVTVDFSTTNANSISIAAIVDADISGDPVRGYDGNSWGSGHTGPKTVAPSGNVSGDVLILASLYTSTSETGVAASGGSTAMTGSPATSGLLFGSMHKVSGATTDTIAATWTGSLTGSAVLFGVAIKGSASGPVITGPNYYYGMISGE